MSETGREMPKYRSVRDVWALKIKEVIRHPNDPESEEPPGATIVPADEGFAPFEVDHLFRSTQNPTPGGYYVVRKDEGLKLFVPGDYFEANYKRLEAGD